MDALDFSDATLTFLFSDIEGSTRLEQEVGTRAYADVRERHRVLLRAAFAACGGEEQGTEGDSFFVVFRTARGALTAAVAAQRAVAAEPWPPGAEIRVRMGIHSGEARVAGGSLVGIDINRAARIAGVAYGGQVLVSDTTRALVHGEPLGDVAFRDLGPHRLKDLQEPQHLYQLVADGLRTDFPGLRSLDGRRVRLPAQLTSFVGRADEVAAAGRLLAEHRLVTLTGPGGTGKTRLAVQLAADAADAFADGVCFVSLDAVRDPGLVASQIATSLGLLETGNRPTRDQLAEWLAGKAILLVLDNFEQVIDAAPLVADLLRAAPDLKLLVTSRAALRISGEHEYPVPGLPTPPDLAELTALERARLPVGARSLEADALAAYESVELFVARATAVRPGFQVTNDNAAAVAAICARLGGMPLAIELAAARVKLLTPEAILSRLTHQLATLAGGSRDRARAPADAARRHRVELRHPRRARTAAARAPLGLPGRDRPRGGRGGLRGGWGSRRRPRRCHRRAGGPEPAPGSRRARAAVRDARDDPRVRRRDAGRPRRGRGGSWPIPSLVPRPGPERRAGARGTRPARLAGPPGAGA